MGHIFSRLPVVPSWPPAKAHRSQNRSSVIPSQPPTTFCQSQKATKNEQGQGKKSLRATQTSPLRVIDEDQGAIQQQSHRYSLNTTVLAGYNRESDRHEAPTTFHSYPELPTELKYAIWEFTLPTQPRVIRLRKRKRDSLHLGGFHVAAWPPTPAAVKTALSTDRASRALVFKNYHPLKLGVRILPRDWHRSVNHGWNFEGWQGHKWLFPAQTVFVSERLGDAVVVKDRDVLVFPYRPARHGLETTTPTYLASPVWARLPASFGTEAPVFTTPGMLLDFFEKWWACLAQQQELDSSPIGWEAEIDFWNSTKEQHVPYILEFKGRKPGACRRLLDKDGS